MWKPVMSASSLSTKLISSAVGNFGGVETRGFCQAPGKDDEYCQPGASCQPVDAALVHAPQHLLRYSHARRAGRSGKVHWRFNSILSGTERTHIGGDTLADGHDEATNFTKRSMSAAALSSSANRSERKPSSASRISRTSRADRANSRITPGSQAHSRFSTLLHLYGFRQRARDKIERRRFGAFANENRRQDWDRRGVFGGLRLALW